jgi:hypothetical protein
VAIDVNGYLPKSVASSTAALSARIGRRRQPRAVESLRRHFAYFSSDCHAKCTSRLGV